MFDIFLLLVIITGIIVTVYNFFDGNKRLAAILRWLAKVMKPKEPEANSDEMFSGVVKPSTTLAHLLVSEMLRSLDVKVENEVRYEGETYEVRYNRWDFKSFQVSVYLGYTKHRMYHDTSGVEPTFKVLAGHVDFDDRELSILREGFKKFRSLQEQQEAVQKEANRQNSALEAISTFMGGSNVPSI